MPDGDTREEAARSVEDAIASWLEEARRLAEKSRNQDQPSEPRDFTVKVSPTAIISADLRRWRSLTTAIFAKSLDLTILCRRIGKLAIMPHRWMKGALNAPDESGRIRMSETKGLVFEGRGHEILQGMKGWRLSALSIGSKPVRALSQRAYSCRTSDRSACLFPKVPLPRGRRSLFALNEFRGLQVGLGAPKRPRSKGASPSSRSTDQRNSK
jgi:hypothetical protein